LFSTACLSEKQAFLFMPLSRQKKEEIIEQVKEKIARQKVGVFVGFSGLKVEDFSVLRRKLKKERGEIKVVKKTLLRLALKKAGLDIDPKELIKDEAAIALGYQDEVSVPKIVWQFSEEFPQLKIKGGILENRFVGPEKIIELAKLPSREHLLAQLVGSLSAPISGLVAVLEGNIKGLLSVLANCKAKT